MSCFPEWVTVVTLCLWWRLIAACKITAPEHICILISHQLPPPPFLLFHFFFFFLSNFFFSFFFKTDRKQIAFQARQRGDNRSLQNELFSLRSWQFISYLTSGSQLCANLLFSARLSVRGVPHDHQRSALSCWTVICEVWGVRGSHFYASLSSILQLEGGFSANIRMWIPSVINGCQTGWSRQ